MAIKVIVELQAKPGKRAELKNLLESVAANWTESARFPGQHAYEVPTTPTYWLRLPIGSRPRCGRRPCSRLCRRRLCTSGGAVSRAIQGDGHQPLP